jgi:hypothetical protein
VQLNRGGTALVAAGFGVLPTSIGIDSGVIDGYDAVSAL